MARGSALSALQLKRAGLVCAVCEVSCVCGSCEQVSFLYKTIFENRRDIETLFEHDLELSHVEIRDFFILSILEIVFLPTLLAYYFRPNRLLNLISTTTTFRNLKNQHYY